MFDESVKRQIILLPWRQIDHAMRANSFFTVHFRLDSPLKEKFCAAIRTLKI
jgi:hypothetical protein